MHHAHHGLTASQPALRIKPQDHHQGTDNVVDHRYRRLTVTGGDPRMGIYFARKKSDVQMEGEQFREDPIAPCN